MYAAGVSERKCLCVMKVMWGLGMPLETLLFLVSFSGLICPAVSKPGCGQLSLLVFFFVLGKHCSLQNCTNSIVYAFLQTIDILICSPCFACY